MIPSTSKHLQNVQNVPNVFPPLNLLGRPGPCKPPGETPPEEEMLGRSSRHSRLLLPASQADRHLTLRTGGLNYFFVSDDLVQSQVRMANSIASKITA